MYLFNANDFCKKLQDIAEKETTLYVLGCFGAPMNTKNKSRYSKNNKYNASDKRKPMIMSATDKTFGFDCVGLIKGILWGWNGDLSKTYGGAKYASNGVPDVGANKMMNTYCTSVSNDFSTITKGEAVWIDGHIGVYVGDGKVVECSPKWKNRVQISNLGNVEKYKKGNYRKWSKHGKLPWIEYPIVVVKNDTNERIYTVVKNDTLSSIALRELGKSSRYREIIKLNNLTTTTIRIGQVLKLPNE